MASDKHSAQSSYGRLFRYDLILPIMVPLSSHRLNQWGQLREILGGVRHPECAAKHSSIDRPRPGISDKYGRFIIMQKGGATNSATNVLSKLWRRLMFDGKDICVAAERHLYLYH